MTFTLVNEQHQGHCHWSRGSWAIAAKEAKEAADVAVRTKINKKVKLDIFERYSFVPMIIFGQNGAGKSTLLHAVKQSVFENVVRSEEVIFISPLSESPQKEYAGVDVHRDDPISW